MNNTKKSRYVIYLEFMQPCSPEHIENQFRYAVEKRILPPFKELMIGIDHKNMRPINTSDITVPMVITDSKELKENV